ncbi:hypothetical protein ACJJTC_015781, partial [Scirpophaga incertulas]
VPQGSNLGPLLFLLFINDLLEVLSCECLAYADDIKIFGRITEVEDSLKLQHDMDMLFDWCLKNNMSLNVAKCNVLTFSRKRNSIKFEYKIGQVVLNKETVIKDLGVWIDSKLSFRQHYDYIVSKCNRTMGFLMRSIRPFKEPNTIIILYKALIRSVLEYCSVVWSPYYDQHRNRIESVQRRFVRHLSTKVGLRRKLQTYEKRLEHFKMDSLENRRYLHSYAVLFKIVNSLWDTSELLHQIKLTFGRYRNQKLFHVPLLTYNVSYNDPLYRVCRNYNTIHNEVDIFHQSLTAFLRDIYAKQIMNQPSNKCQP